MVSRGASLRASRAVQHGGSSACGRGFYGWRLTRWEMIARTLASSRALSSSAAEINTKSSLIHEYGAPSPTACSVPSGHTR